MTKQKGTPDDDDNITLKWLLEKVVVPIFSSWLGCFGAIVAAILSGVVLTVGIVVIQKTGIIGNLPIALIPSVTPTPTLGETPTATVTLMFTATPNSTFTETPTSTPIATLTETAVPTIAPSSTDIATLIPTSPIIETVAPISGVQADLCSVGSLSNQSPIYRADFQGAIGSEWSIGTQDTAPNGVKFLGQFQNNSVFLRLSNLPSHTSLIISFDLLIIRSWDGSYPQQDDVWELSANNRLLLRTTFDNQTSYKDHFQAYPGSYPSGVYPPRTCAYLNNSLGYIYNDQFLNEPMDATYRMRFTIPHNSSSLVLDFSVADLEGVISDESWGLDNVQVGSG